MHASWASSQGSWQVSCVSKLQVSLSIMLTRLKTSSWQLHLPWPRNISAFVSGSQDSSVNSSMVNKIQILHYTFYIALRIKTILILHLFNANNMKSIVVITCALRLVPYLLQLAVYDLPSWKLLFCFSLQLI